MTYPGYPQQGYPQQPAPPGYAPQPPAQQYPHQGYPHQGYPQQPPPAAPAPTQYPATVEPADPTGGQGGPRRPMARNLMHRTIALVPTAYDPNNKFPGDAEPRPKVTCDLYVLDGGPLYYGEGQRPPTPPTMHMPAVPAFWEGVWLTGNVAGAVKDFVGTGRPVYGRFVPGDKNPQAQIFTRLGGDLDPRAAERDALWEQLTNLIVAHRKELWTPPTAIELNGGASPAHPHGAPSWVPAQQYPGAPAPAGPVNYAAPALPTPPAVLQLPTPPVPAAAPVAPYWPQGWTQQLWDTQGGDKLSPAEQAQWAQVPRATPVAPGGPGY